MYLPRAMRPSGGISIAICSALLCHPTDLHFCQSEGLGVVFEHIENEINLSLLTSSRFRPGFKRAPERCETGALEDLPRSQRPRRLASRSPQVRAAAVVQPWPRQEHSHCWSWH